VFWALAQRLGLPLQFAGVELDMETAPTTDELLANMLRDAQVPLAEIRRHPRGAVFALEPAVVAPARPERAGNRFEVAPPDVFAELAEVAAEPARQRPQRAGQAFRFLLSSRRVRDVMNTTYRQLPVIRKRMPGNPLWMHPDDMAELGLGKSAAIEIRSAHGAIRTVVEADPSMRRGVVSIAHGFGGLGRGGGNGEAAINELVPLAEYVEPINGMPWFSALPVDVRAVG
jgi:anaerobic selenocysteine-containing dehydrogenase